MKIENKNGKIFINADGKFLPFAAYRSFHPNEKYVKDFYKSGFRFFNIFPSGIMTAVDNRTVPYSQFGPVWVGDGKYNWDNLKKQLEVFDKNCPDAKFALLIHLDTPQWFIDEHEGMADTWEEFICEADNPLWRNGAKEYMHALIDKCDELMDDRIFGYLLMAGGTTEWYTRFIDRAMDNPSENHIKSYKNWCSDDNAKIPSFAEYTAVQHGIFTEDENVLRYRRYLSEKAEETVNYFIDAAKTYRPDKLVGVFFGYVSQDCANAVKSGYNETHKVFGNKNLDIICCPASYNFRKLESTSAFRLPVDTFRLNNMLYIHEIDAKTHISYKNPVGTSHMQGINDTFKTLSETSAYLKREVSLALSKGQGFWIFDMFGGWFDDAELMEEMAKIHKLSDYLADKDNESISETALFVDLESNYYIGCDADYPMNELQMRNMNLTAIPWDNYLTDDLLNENFDYDKYKLYIFPNLFKPKKEILEKIQLLRKMGKCLLFMHASGYIDFDGAYNGKNMQALTGLKLEKCNFTNSDMTLENGEDFGFTFEVNAWRKMRGEKRESNEFQPIFRIDEDCEVLGRYKSDNSVSAGLKVRENGGFDAYVAASPLTPGIVRYFAQRADVFAYGDEGDIIYLNKSMISVYSHKECKKNIRWKNKAKLRDFYNGEVFETDKNGVKIPFKEKETRIFIVE